MVKRKLQFWPYLGEYGQKNPKIGRILSYTAKKLAILAV
jgi:hypothetical protein